MQLAPGSAVGAYQIVSPLGEGGMGQVYRGRDQKLNRDVAIKILPDVFAHDGERVARFTREAQTLASLNHPNIAQIYGVLEEPPPAHLHALVMELVEGDELSALMARGPMPFAEALPIAKQIADALETAHDQGIVHRDLKPANIKVRADGTVKVLDFGLAKALAADNGRSPTDPSASPTMTAGSTQMGMIIGTAAYMAPEQARGKPVDRRADIWAFGVVLFEMLSGRRLFEGEEVSDILAAVLRQDIDWRAVPAGTPPAVVALLRRCLERDSRQRLRDIGEARIVLMQPADAGASREEAPRLRRPGRAALASVAGIAAVAFVAGFGAAWMTRRPGAGQPSSSTLSIAPVSASGNVISASVSPDGRYMAYVESEQGMQSLWLQQLDGGQTLRLVPEAGVAYWNHVFTPDGNNIVYGVKSDADPKGALYRISTLGGTPRRLIGDIDSAPSFSPDGRRMTFLRQYAPSPDQSSLVVCDADGSNARILASVRLPEHMAGIFFGGPAWSPDGRTIVTAVGRRGLPGAEARAKLVQITVDTGQVSTLADPGWFQAAQSIWTPDGKSVLVIARGPDQAYTQIWSVAVPGGAARRITSDLNDHRILSLTSDGRTLVSLAGSVTAHVSVMSVKGGGRAARIGRSTIDGLEGVAFAADGRVVYTSRIGGRSSVWLTKPDGADRSPLIQSDPEEVLYYPLVDTAGRSFYVSNSPRGYELRSLAKDAASPLTIAHDVRRVPISAPADGRFVAYSASVDGVSRVFTVGPDGAGRTQITSAPSFLPAVDREGRRVAYYYVKDGLYRIGVSPIGGGPLVADLPAEAPTSNSRLMLNGDAIYLNTVRGDRANVWRQPLDGRAAERLTAFEDQVMFDFGLSDDRTALAIVRGARLRDAQIITGFTTANPAAGAPAGGGGLRRP